MTTKTGLLRIGRFSSRCNDCGRGADPTEKTHQTVLTYRSMNDIDPEVGCGIEWQYVSSEYLGDEEATKKLRPDLIFLPETFVPDGVPQQALDFTIPREPSLLFMCRPCARQAYEFCDGGLCGFSAEFISHWKQELERLASHDDWNPITANELANDLLKETVTWPSI